MNRPARLFVGVGNPLCGDDGLGVKAAEMLSRLPLPPDVEVYDAGTIGLDAASALESRRLVVVADAIDAGEEPGAIFRLAPEELRATQVSGLSLHDLNLLDALSVTRLTGRAPDRVVVLCMQVADVSYGMSLSAPVTRALPRLLEMALKELRLDPALMKNRDRPPAGRVIQMEVQP